VRRGAPAGAAASGLAAAASAAEFPIMVNGPLPERSRRGDAERLGARKYRSVRSHRTNATGSGAAFAQIFR